MFSMYFQSTESKALEKSMTIEKWVSNLLVAINNLLIDAPPGKDMLARESKGTKKTL
jgi:hypothetical protein